MSTTTPARKPAKKTAPRKASASDRPMGWSVIQATGGCSFVEKWGPKGLVERFTLRFDEGDAPRLAKLLNQLEGKKPGTSVVATRP